MTDIHGSAAWPQQLQQQTLPPCFLCDAVELFKHALHGHHMHVVHEAPLVSEPQPLDNCGHTMLHLPLYFQQQQQSLKGRLTRQALGTVSPFCLHTVEPHQLCLSKVSARFGQPSTCRTELSEDVRQVQPSIQSAGPHTVKSLRQRWIDLPEFLKGQLKRVCEVSWALAVRTAESLMRSRGHFPERPLPARSQRLKPGRGTHELGVLA